MIIVCKMRGCPYNSNNDYLNNNFCWRPHMISIDQRGMCSQIWKNGNPRQQYPPFDDVNYPKEKKKLVDVAETELSSGEKEDVKRKEELDQRGD